MTPSFSPSMSDKMLPSVVASSKSSSVWLESRLNHRKSIPETAASLVFNDSRSIPTDCKGVYEWE